MLCDVELLTADKKLSFDKSLFYGHELSLVIFEVLFFAMMDLAAQNYVFDGAMLYLFMEVRPCVCTLCISTRCQRILTKGCIAVGGLLWGKI